MVKFDYARIRKQFGSIWLFIGDYRHTREDKTAVWIDQDGNEKHFSYIDWRVVAHGDTWEEFMESAKEYFRICGMTMVEYLEEKTGCDLSEYRKHMVDADSVRLIINKIKELSEDEKEFY